MKKKLITSISFLSVFSLVLAPVAYAQQPDDVRERIEQKRQEIEERKNQREPIKFGKKEIQRPDLEKRQKINEIRRNIIRRFWERMTKRIEAAIERQEKFVERLEARMAVFEERGKDVSGAQEHLDTAKESLDEAGKKLEGAKTSAEELFEGDIEDSRELFKEIRALVHESVQNIKDAHGEIVETLRVLKGMSDVEEEDVAEEEEDDEEENEEDNNDEE